jgi:hypothetical protein
MAEHKKDHDRRRWKYRSLPGGKKEKE